MPPLLSRSVAFLCSGLVLLGLGVGGGCAESGGGAPVASARLEGQVLGREASRGDAYVFLFEPGRGPPEEPGTPLYVTAVPELRRASGDSRYPFSEVRPGAYRLWGFLDANGDVDLTVDVLAQPGAGDWVPDAAVEREVSAGERAMVDLSLARRVRHSAPAFRVTGRDGGVVEVTDAPALVSVDVEAEGLGLVLGEDPRFFVRFRDTDGDGRADDLDGDGLPDVFPQFFLRWVPAPGQGGSVDAGAEPQVVVPLLFNPLPFATVLQGDVTREVAAERLQLFVVPQARVVTRGADAGTVMTPLAAMPVGEYELWAVSAEGAFWHVPNALGARDGEVLRSQALRFRVVRGGSPDGGAAP